ncbi:MULTISPECIES: hypothetical protein [unclassified Streptomyces]|uniref:hypothetical protein n=1 Tax=unclassified Streptomyces TaxID=2593676 RepID=UPI00332997DB
MAAALAVAGTLPASAASQGRGPGGVVRQGLDRLQGYGPALQGRSRTGDAGLPCFGTAPRGIPA